MIAGPILGIDTATTRAVVALSLDGGERVWAEAHWIAGYRHGEELLARIEGLLAVAGVRPADLAGIVVGTGPGAFTGLRVGIATAKGLAHALALPIVGVATSAALLDAAGGDVLLVPAGAAGRVCARRDGAPWILAGGTEPDLRPGERLVAVDLAGRASEEAVARGTAALDGLGAALLRLGWARLTAGDADDLATLVPEYVTLPRGAHGALADADVTVTGGTGAVAR